MFRIYEHIDECSTILRTQCHQACWGGVVACCELGNCMPFC
jgi:hypothetical protein